MNRGGATVGYLSNLPQIEAASVIYLRLWCHSPDTQAQVRSEFATSLGVEDGRDAIRAFEELIKLCTTHCRRPLVRHSISCKCLGADEACFANFVAVSAMGCPEDAMMLAALMARADSAPMLLTLARQVGLAFRRMQLSAPVTQVSTTRQYQPTLH